MAEAAIESMFENVKKMKYGSCNGCNQIFKYGDKILAICEPWNQTPFDLKYCSRCIAPQDAKDTFKFIERLIDENDRTKIHLLKSIFIFAVKNPAWRLPSKTVLMKIKQEKPRDIVDKMLELNIITQECYDEIFLYT